MSSFEDEMRQEINKMMPTLVKIYFLTVSFASVVIVYHFTSRILFYLMDRFELSGGDVFLICFHVSVILSIFATVRGFAWKECNQDQRLPLWVAAIPAGVYALLMSIFGVWFL